jgi:hypothetical protein
LFELLALARHALIEQDHLSDRLQCVAINQFISRSTFC